MAEKFSIEPFTARELFKIMLRLFKIPPADRSPAVEELAIDAEMVFRGIGPDPWSMAPGEEEFLAECDAEIERDRIESQQLQEAYYGPKGRNADNGRGIDERTSPMGLRNSGRIWERAAPHDYTSNATDRCATRGKGADWWPWPQNLEPSAVRFGDAAPAHLCDQASGDCAAQQTATVITLTNTLHLLTWMLVGVGALQIALMVRK